MQNHSSIHIQGISKTNHTKAMKKSCQLQKKTENAVLQQRYLAITIHNETEKYSEIKERERERRVKRWKRRREKGHEKPWLDHWG